MGFIERNNDEIPGGSLEFRHEVIMPPRSMGFHSATFLQAVKVAEGGRMSSFPACAKVEKPHWKIYSVGKSQVGKVATGKVAVFQLRLFQLRLFQLQLFQLRLFISTFPARYFSGLC